MLDIRTVVVMLVISSLLMAVTLTVGIKTGRPADFAKWNTGLALVGLGWFLVALRGLLPDLVTIALADALLITGFCMKLAAIIEFGGGSTPRLLLIAPGLLVFLMLIPLSDSYVGTTFLMSFAMVVLFCAVAAAAIRFGQRGGAGRWIIAVSCFASMAMLIVRAAQIWLYQDTYTSVYVSSHIQAVTFIAIFASIIVVPIGFLLMHRERDEMALHKLATVDALTGLFNRRAFIDLAGREMSRAHRLKLPFAVLMVDLDLFKRVNDEYGHQAGDQVLADFAAEATRSVRAEDLVGRYGGEEFCILLPGTLLPQAITIADRLRSAVSQRPLGNLPRVTTVSVGVAACSGAFAVSLDTAIRCADTALYRAKQDGRNRVVGVDIVSEDESIAAHQT